MSTFFGDTFAMHKICRNSPESPSKCHSHLPSCFSFQHKFPCYGHNLDLPASCHIQRATWSFLADVHTGSYGIVGEVPSPAAANNLRFQHPTGRGAEEDTREKPLKLTMLHHFILAKNI